MAKVTPFKESSMKHSIPLQAAHAWLIALLITAAVPAHTLAQAAVSPAAVIAGQLVTPGTTILSISDFTPATDPDLLLGAPGQYVAKARFVDSTGVQGDVEVFASARDERARARLLAGMATAGQEVDVEQGLILVRFYGLVGDGQAYRDALTRAVSG
jgi:hypothetical protein